MLVMTRRGGIEWRVNYCYYLYYSEHLLNNSVFIRPKAQSGEIARHTVKECSKQLSLRWDNVRGLIMINVSKNANVTLLLLIELTVEYETCGIPVGGVIHRAEIMGKCAIA